jgi:hypothetical protein
MRTRTKQFLHVTETLVGLTCDLETVVKGITVIEIVCLHVAEICTVQLGYHQKETMFHWLLIPTTGKLFVQIVVT